MRYRVAISFLPILIAFVWVAGLSLGRPIAITQAQSGSGYKDIGFYYKPVGAAFPLVQSPTGEKPQSKLWFHDGAWWGSLFNNVAGQYRIYKLNWATQQWADTGVTLDPRPESKADVLWDGTHLYVVSGGGADPSGAGTRKPLDAWLFRYSYSSGTYTLNSGYPVTVRTGGAETIVLDKDTAGRLWITYTKNNKVYVNYSRSSDSDWDAANPLLLNIPGTNPNVAPDDISTLVAFGGKLGVLWSNQNDGAFYFAYHTDGTAPANGSTPINWTGRSIYQQTNGADDHINIKSIQSDPSGNVYAMVKTSYNSSGSPQLLLIVGRKQGGSYTWTVYIHSYRDAAQTRPLLLIDNENREVYVFTTDEGGGNVYYKKTSLDNIDLQYDPKNYKGTLFMTAGGFALNNVTSTKQSVNAATGIVVMASHENQTKIDSEQADYYFHNAFSLNSVWPTAIATNTPKPGATAIPTATSTQTKPNTNKRVFIPVVKR